MKKITIISLFIILIFALIVRVYKLDSVPPSISWDEAAVGVNAWAIANFGKDEYGKSFPLYFKSFGDDKHPIHIYMTALSERFFGLNELGTRLPSAMFGTLNVFLIFLIGRLIFKNNLIALSASLFLAVSPYNIHFSRFNHEANFVLSFFMLGIILFYLSLNKSIYLPLSILSFCIAFITYHPAKIIVPIIWVILIILYKKQVSKDKYFLAAIFVLVFFLILLILNRQLLGFARVNQTIQGNEDIQKTKLYQLTRSDLMGRANLILVQYSWHFSPQFLFISGDKNPRLSSQTGEFYKLDALLLILGVFYLLYKRTKESVVLLSWALFAPLPSALVAEAPHAGRALFMMGSFHLISALGLYFVIGFFKKPLIKLVVTVLIFIILVSSLINYLSFYFGEYAKRYAIEWQYGMKQIVEFVKDNPQYNQISVTDKRSQPYIFFLYYLKTPLPQYLRTVIYNRGENKSYNNVAHFDRYYFGGWDPIESKPLKEALYVLTPSEYDGLRHKSLFDIKMVIYYPNDTSAFYLVSTHEK